MKKILVLVTLMVLAVATVFAGEYTNEYSRWHWDDDSKGRVYTLADVMEDFHQGRLYFDEDEKVESYTYDAGCWDKIKLDTVEDEMFANLIKTYGWVEENFWDDDKYVICVHYWLEDDKLWSTIKFKITYVKD